MWCSISQDVCLEPIVTLLHLSITCCCTDITIRSSTLAASIAVRGAPIVQLLIRCDRLSSEARHSLACCLATLKLGALLCVLFAVRR